LNEELAIESDKLNQQGRAAIGPRGLLARSGEATCLSSGPRRPGTVRRHGETAKQCWIVKLEGGFVTDTVPTGETGGLDLR
jgi:hypothetical protein